MKIKINKEAIKSNVLFGYIVLTFLAAYAGAMFYFGTQFAHADSDTVHVKTVQSPQAAPKALSR